MWAILTGVLDQDELPDSSERIAKDLRHAADFYLGTVACIQRLVSTGQYMYGAGEPAGGRGEGGQADGDAPFFMGSRKSQSHACTIPVPLAARVVELAFGRAPEGQAGGPARARQRADSVIEDVRGCLEGVLATTVDADVFLVQLLYSRRRQVGEQILITLSSLSQHSLNMACCAVY